jgi:wyosine [tRNA(Phe)-imidazoG37] synthetase (radical SAM superfamily)
MPENAEKLRFIYGPVKSWRSGTSLGVDPIGEISTCSFNCSYCQLGKMQNHIYKVETYVPTEKIINDFKELQKEGRFNLDELDVITFAGSGEPTLAENLGEIIDELKKLTTVPISILTNATTLSEKQVRDSVLKAGLVSLKLDAPDDNYLKSINQAVDSISVDSIVNGIKLLKDDMRHRNDVPKLQIQIMFLEKFAKDKAYIEKLCALINELEIYNIQINTPSRPKPVSKTGDYWIETRGNHYSGDEAPVTPDFIEFRELPVIDQDTAFAIEKEMRDLLNKEAHIINVYKK